MFMIFLKINQKKMTEEEEDKFLKENPVVFKKYIVKRNRKEIKQVIIMKRRVQKKIQMQI